jgi:hypothetical protein
MNLFLGQKLNLALRHGESLTPEISLLVKYKDGTVYPATGLSDLKFIIWKDSRKKEALCTLTELGHGIAYDTATGSFSLSAYIAYSEIALPLGKYFYEAAHTTPEKITMFYGDLEVIS